MFGPVSLMPFPHRRLRAGRRSTIRPAGTCSKGLKRASAKTQPPDTASVAMMAVGHLLSVGATPWPKQGEEVALLLGEDEDCVPGFRVDLCRLPEHLSHTRARADLDVACTQILEQAPRIEQIDGLDHPRARSTPR